MTDIAISELGYEAVETDEGIKIFKNGEDYTLNAEESAKVTAIVKRLEFEEYETNIQAAIQNLLDSTAKSLRYDDMMSVRSYTGFPNEFQRECMGLAIWAGDVWKAITDIESSVLSGKRELPTIQQVLNEVPKYVK